MKIVQEIVVVILKTMCYKLLASSLDQNERRFITRMQDTKYFGNLQVIPNREGEFLLVWQSKLGAKVACVINEMGFIFSDVRVYNERDKTLFTIGAGDKWIIEEETEEIKTLFRTFTSLVDTCFK